MSDHALVSRSGSAQGRPDRLFRVSTAGAGLLIVAVIVAIGVFLVVTAVPALRADHGSFLTERQWLPDATPSRFGIAAIAFGTLLTSLLALVIAVPVALGVALYITEYASPRVATAMSYLSDLLAAVPSVIYGLWGVLFLVPHLNKLQTFLTVHLGFLPIFRNDSGIVGRSLFAASVVLAIMILPIIAAITREIFAQVPSANREAALALGATKLEMIRVAVLPYSRAGLVSGVMLGLGRALGETIAVALVLSASFAVSIQVLSGLGGNTIAANIATKFGEAGIPGRGALVASGLVLFVITFAVNGLARLVLHRSTRLERASA
ncbi:MAG: phosphate ABC transporter permease subunit PstC [Mycobacteriales bacterium]